MSPRDQLSQREVQVATMVWEGKTNPEIAAVLCSTEQVVKNQLRGIFDKLGVWSRLELALYVASHGGTKLGDNGVASRQGRSHVSECRCPDCVGSIVSGGSLYEVMPSICRRRN